MAPEALLKDKLVKYVFPNVKISITLDRKALNLHKTSYFGS